MTTFENLKIIVQDMEKVVEHAQVPEDLAGRLHFSAWHMTSLLRKMCRVTFSSLAYDGSCTTGPMLTT